MTDCPAAAPGATLGEFERATLAAAEQAFARVMTGVPDQVETMPPELEAADALRWTGDRVTELLAGFAELPLDRLAGLATPGTADHSHDHGRATTTADTSGPGPVGEPLSIRGVPGSTAQLRVWVHSVGDVAPAQVRFELATMVAPDGTPWTGPDATFEPAELAVPAPVGATTLLSLAIPGDAGPGSHHGLVIGCGVVGAVVPISVVIT